MAHSGISPISFQQACVRLTSHEDSSYRRLKYLMADFSSPSNSAFFEADTCNLNPIYMFSSFCFRRLQLNFNRKIRQNKFVMVEKMAVEAVLLSYRTKPLELSGREHLSMVRVNTSSSIRKNRPERPQHILNYSRIEGHASLVFLPKNSHSFGEITIFFRGLTAPPTLCLASPSRYPLGRK